MHVVLYFNESVRGKHIILINKFGSILLQDYDNNAYFIFFYLPLNYNIRVLYYKINIHKLTKLNSIIIILKAS